MSKRLPIIEHILSTLKARLWEVQATTHLAPPPPPPPPPPPRSSRTIWCLVFTNKSMKGVLQHLQANHEQELCHLATIAYAKMTVVKKNRIVEISFITMQGLK